MTQPMAPDLRALAAADAIRSAHLLEVTARILADQFGATWLGYRVLADRILAAVLPVHREQVLTEAADALASNGDCDCSCREVNLTREPDDRMHTGGCSWWPNPAASEAVRRLAATGPRTPPASTRAAEQGEVVPRKAPGCPEIVWDGPYSYRCGLGDDAEVCARHGHFGPPPASTETAETGPADGLSEPVAAEQPAPGEPTTPGPIHITSDTMDTVRAQAARRKLGRPKQFDEAQGIHDTVACGHDLEAFDGLTVALARVRAVAALLRQPGRMLAPSLVVRLLDAALGDAPGPAGMDPAEHTAVERLAGDVAALTAERDRLADTIRRHQPVIDAAKAWRAADWTGWPHPAAVDFHLAVDELEGARTVWAPWRDGVDQPADTPDTDPTDQGEDRG